MAKLNQILVSVTLLLLICTQPAYAQVSTADEVVGVQSGSTAVGTKDPNVSYFQLPGYAERPRVLNPADFDAAANGTKAWVIEPHPAWLQKLTEDQNAKWVSSQSLYTTEGISALYAIPFKIEKPINSVTFEISFSVDDFVSYQNQVGIFVNGTQLNCDNFSARGAYNNETLLTCTVTPVNILKQGNNTLYFLVSNVFGPSAIMFGTKVLVNPTQQAQGGASVQSIETQNTTFTPTPSATPSATPAALPIASQSAQTSTPEQLPKTGTPFEVMLGFIAASIWGYYFYLRFKIN